MTLNLKSVAIVPYVDPFSEVRGVVLALIFKTRRKKEEEERTNTRACSALRRRS